MSQPEQKPTDQQERPHGWRQTLLVALLVAALALVGAGGAGFAAGQVLTRDDGPVRCTSWNTSRCMPGLDLDATLATLAERGFECERREWPEDWASLGSTESDRCSLAEYRTTFASLKGQVNSLSASVPVLPDVSLTPHQEAFLSWVAVLPFAGRPASAEAASSWLSEQLASGVDIDTNIDGYDYSVRNSGSDSGRLVLEVDAGVVEGWFR